MVTLRNSDRETGGNSPQANSQDLRDAAFPRMPNVPWSEVASLLQLPLGSPERDSIATLLNRFCHSMAEHYAHRVRGTIHSVRMDRDECLSGIISDVVLRSIREVKFAPETGEDDARRHFLVYIKRRMTDLYRRSVCRSRIESASKDDDTLACGEIHEVPDRSVAPILSALSEEAYQRVIGLARVELTSSQFSALMSRVEDDSRDRSVHAAKLGVDKSTYSSNLRHARKKLASSGLRDKISRILSGEMPKG